MTAGGSALYRGRVTHHRFRPAEHRLAYRVFWLVLDVDEIGGLAKRLWLFSRNRFNLFSFYDRDYAGMTAEPLREQVEQRLREGGVEPDGGAIRLLTMPRILGYAFNPLSVYFCQRRDGALAALLYEVHNTFGERHSYLIPVSGADTLPIRQECPKAFYVSPFMPMDMTYAFRVVPPGERVTVAITGRDAEGPLITAALSGQRQTLSDAALARAALVYPLLTLKVIAGIHWEALRLWLKKVRLVPKPKPKPKPERPLSAGAARSHPLPPPLV